MKLLMIYMHNFAFKPNIKTIDTAKDAIDGGEATDALVGLIHVEAEDAEKSIYAETKLVKNLKWAARRNNTNRIVLHSFAHLSDSNSSPGFASKLFDNVEARLRNASYEVLQTPFGYFHDLKIDAPGYSFARLFKSF
ncbi:MAG: hypothetical protein CO189_06825 [candidate division Zixibacteria bacterium CG_4_9_14_3_um_filter_46_8]|nr:MAG: hypothetical protein CO189_06825 [candidate division Zixibacteria bacterium CG_4_9_14_3_um_filter_46_8]